MDNPYHIPYNEWQAMKRSLRQARYQRRMAEQLHTIEQLDRERDPIWVEAMDRDGLDWREPSTMGRASV